MGKIISINISEKKGTVKKPVDKIKILEGFGLENDAHGGNWHRQVSLLSYESFLKFKDDVKIDLSYGVFGENLLVEGIDIKNLEIGTRLKINNSVLEVSQIGKMCHKGCEIRDIVGRCIMPDEGIFTKVISGDEIKVGDEICIEHV
ncbi:MAG: MOSC domain-containing protein [Peptoniphilaceae bacterium]